MKFKPLFDRVLIKPSYKENKTESGLVLPETSQERPQIGEVIAVGDGTNFENQETEIKVNVGDKVVFSKYAGTELKIDDVNYIVLRQIDIIGVIND